VRLLKYATPVKAKTSAPTPDLPSSCAALTWRGVEVATRTGSRERGSGRRQTLDRQQDRGELLHCRGKERFGNRLGDSVGARRSGDMPQVAPFFVSKSQVVHFFVVTWPPNLSSSDIFKEISGPDPDEKLAPNIIDKYISPHPTPRLERQSAHRRCLVLPERLVRCASTSRRGLSVSGEGKPASTPGRSACALCSTRPGKTSRRGGLALT